MLLAATGVFTVYCFSIDIAAINPRLFPVLTNVMCIEICIEDLHSSVKLANQTATR